MAKKLDQAAGKGRIAAKDSPPPPGPEQPAVAIEEPTESLSHFFKREDWLAGFLTALFSGIIFFYNMAPEVTLQDSGELVTGAFTFGVPHPPGYPLWAFLGFVWSHFIVPFGNPAWRIGTMSVVTGAFVVGVMTVMMTRSIRLLLHSLPFRDSVDESLQHWIALTIGASSAMLFGFNRGVWLWACVSEMRVLSVFSFVLISCVFFGWAVQPHRRGFLYASLLLFGLSLANHQTIAVMAAPFALGVLAVGLEQFVTSRRKAAAKPAWFPDLMTHIATFWELTAAGALSGMAGLFVLAWLRSPQAALMHRDPAFGQALAAGATGVLLLVAGRLTGWWRIRRALACTGLLLLGVSFYLYMPLAASTNPPMNWGYAATKEGFLHAITRGQYEKIQSASVFSEAFVLKVWVFIKALVAQYSLPLTLLGLVSAVLMVVWWRRLKPHGRAWLVFVWAAFLVTSIGLLTIINPKLDRQEQEINIKFFAPAHGFYAMLIGYGIAAILAALAWLSPRRLTNWLLRISCVLLLALPLVTYSVNWSLCALRGHDFGYLFGYLMFTPGNGYPEMERNAVLYGGTDPGRFVPTYMIYCESRVAPKDRFRDKSFDRSDVYIITQNALADATYMSYIRDQYDYNRPKNDTYLDRLLGRDHVYPPDPIYIPSAEEGNMAFKQYVDDVQAGRIPASADIKIEGGRVSVQGVGGVMAINGILARWIFDRNKDKHAFYVEESYVIPWMYPFLRPHGVIMQICKDQLPSPQQDPKLWADLVARDKAYWDKLTTEFLAREDFRRNNDAKKSFSKMRSAIAGLYAYRQMTPEAEYAFKQSLQLCPESPEANFRLADLYMQLRRYAEARKLIEGYQLLDIYNTSAGGFLNTIKGLESADARRLELEKQMQQGRAELGVALELASVYQRLNMEGQFQNLTRSILSSTNLPPNAYMAVAQIYGNAKRWDLLSMALRRYLEFDAQNFKTWIELAFSEMAQGKQDEGLAALRKSVETGGEAARAILRNDARFTPMRQRPEFRALVPPAKEQQALPFPFSGDSTDMR